MAKTSQFVLSILVTVTTVVTLVMINRSSTSTVYGSTWTNYNIYKEIRIVKNKVCPENTKVVILVSSNPKRADFRAATRKFIRSTEMVEKNFRVYFLIGKPNDTSDIGDEDSLNNDMIQGDFVDSYRNLTLKHLMGLQWVSKNCKSVQFIIKQDDDSAVNVLGLVEEFSRNLQKVGPIAMAGVQIEGKNSLPQRDPTSKWYVTRAEYPQDTYPSFLSGWAYITNPQTISAILRQTQNRSFFWIDDVLVTGILSQAAGVKHIPINDNTAVSEGELACCQKYPNETCYALLGPTSKAKELEDFLSSTLQCYKRKCPTGRKRLCIVPGKHARGPVKGGVPEVMQVVL